MDMETMVKVKVIAKIIVRQKKWYMVRVKGKVNVSIG